MLVISTKCIDEQTVCNPAEYLTRGRVCESVCVSKRENNMEEKKQSQIGVTAHGQRPRGV